MNPFKKGGMSYGCQQISPEFSSKDLIEENVINENQSCFRLLFVLFLFTFSLLIRPKGEKSANEQLDFGSTMLLI